MKSKKFILAFTCILILILFSSSAIASENIDNETSAEISLNDENIEVESISQTHVVDGSAYNQMNNPTIQTAINNAKSGDTIEITGTEYVHCHFVVNKRLTIISAVGTTMSPCPSNVQGSNGIGIFYIDCEASGTVISGFTLINEEYKSGTIDPYGIYVNGADNVIISNCTVKKTSFGPGILVDNAKNTEIVNCTITNSKKGIYFENCENGKIENNLIDSNIEAGIYIGLKSVNLNINKNTIHANNFYGIYLGSATNTKIQSNKITENRDNKVAQRAVEGTGIYVDTTVTKLEIKGNLISENGRYGIYDSPKFTNMVDQYTQIVDGNYFISHSERAIFHADPKGQTTIVYVWSNYYSNELFCGGTCYEPGVLISDHSRDLIMGEIKEVKKGVYSVSFIRKDTGAIATSLNAIDVTFFLNKNNTSPIPLDGEIYKICPIINGTATVDFRNQTYLETNNTICAVGPGNGIITYNNAGARPSQKLSIPDSHIPTGDAKVSTSINGSGLIKYYGDSTRYSATLLSENGPLANRNITITINGKSYIKTTNASGTASMNINLESKNYTVELSFMGDDEYESVTSTDSISIKPTVNGDNLIKYFQNDTQYYASFTDTKGSPLSNKTIKFNIKGVFYERKTNDQGIAKLNINLDEGKYIITAENPVNNEKFSNNITVLPIIIENNNLTKYFQNDSQYTVKLLNKQGKPVSGENVRFNINGVFYDRKTDDQGIAKLNINLLNGTYIITATANKFATSNTIKVLPIIKSESIKMKENDRIPFTVTLLDNQGKPIANNNVTFNINGVLYTKTSNSEGIASLTIRLSVGKYVITSKYKKFVTSNTVEVLKANEKASTHLTSSNVSFLSGETKEFSVVLKNENNRTLEKQNIEFEVDGKKYSSTTNSNGEAKLSLNLEPGTYIVKSKYIGNNLYKPTESSNNINIQLGRVVGDASNEELQKIINNGKENETIKLIADSYSNISLIINNPITLTAENSLLNGAKNKNVITLNVDGANVNGIKIKANNGTAIEVTGNNNEIKNCIIKNNLDSKLMEEYNSGKITMPENGIKVANGENNRIVKNEITNFKNGIYLENTNKNEIINNTISKNNYGIEFGSNVSNTLIENNEINENIGLITLEVVEGPLGFGISLRKSAVNVTILNNNIKNNYEGIFIDAQNSTGIIITGNLITNNTIEGITFNENYTYANNAVQPIVENNAIFNNAKGPSMIILGEVSANPAGIYGPGEWNDSLKLHLGSNWYGTNKYTTWGNITGPGTICPRISTTLITFNMSLINPGKYEIKFYNNGNLATALPDFEVYFTLNFYTEKQIEKIASVKNGVAIIEFEAENYYDTGNVIESSSGSLFDLTRKYPVTFTYNVPDSEIKK